MVLIVPDGEGGFVVLYQSIRHSILFSLSAAASSGCIRRATSKRQTADCAAFAIIAPHENGAASAPPKRHHESRLTINVTFYDRRYECAVLVEWVESLDNI